MIKKAVDNEAGDSEAQRESTTNALPVELGNTRDIVPTRLVSRLVNRDGESYMGRSQNLVRNMPSTVNVWLGLK
jgi:hypothetical protein